MYFRNLIQGKLYGTFIEQHSQDYISCAQLGSN